MDQFSSVIIMIIVHVYVVIGDQFLIIVILRFAASHSTIGFLISMVAESGKISCAKMLQQPSIKLINNHNTYFFISRNECK